MQGYQCRDCLSIFDEPIRRLEREFDGLDSGPYRESEYWICRNPKCGSEDVEEIEVCPTCEEARVHESYGLCISCAQKMTSNERLSDALREIALMPLNKEIAK